MITYGLIDMLGDLLFNIDTYKNLDFEKLDKKVQEKIKDNFYFYRNTFSKVLGLIALAYVVYFFLHSNFILIKGASININLYFKILLYFTGFIFLALVAYDIYGLWRYKQYRSIVKSGNYSDKEKAIILFSKLTNLKFSSELYDDFHTTSFKFKAKIIDGVAFGGCIYLMLTIIILMCGYVIY